MNRARLNSMMGAAATSSRNPTLILKALSWAVKSGVVTRGYGWALAHLPAVLWGGENIRALTELGPMVVPLRDPASTGLLLWGCIPHEVRETALLKVLVRDYSVVFDVGAHVGWYARLFWEQMQEGSQVYAFEPNPAVFPYLEENTRNQHGLFCRQLAVGESVGSMVFYCAVSSNLSSMARQVGNPIEVKATTLDSVCSTWGTNDKVDLIKCDVEGGELAVLRGARRLRSGALPPIWMLEVDCSFLADVGISTDELNAEILNWGGPVKLFYLDSTGKAVEISDVARSAGVPNIFVVPQIRIARFLNVVELVRS